MRIHCGNCSIKLENNDVVIMNFANILTHLNCYELTPELIRDIGTYEQIINKYWFFQELDN